MQDEQELLETSAEALDTDEALAQAEADANNADNHIEVSESPPVTVSEQVQLPTVHILVERSPEGNIEVDVVPTGDVRATEIETVLKMGLAKWRQKINLPG